jgi:aminopeptidase
LPETETSNKLASYADLAIHVGLNLQPGQRLVVSAPVEAAPFVRLVTESAYKLGARYVDVVWGDDALRLLRFQYAPRDSFEEFPAWRADGMLGCAKRGDAFLSIHATDPQLLKDQDPELITTAQRVEQTHRRPYLEYITRDKVNWCVVSLPIPSWADRVFQDLPKANRLSALRDAIYAACRIDLADPVAAWQEHAAQLQARCGLLNRKRYSALHLTGPGTDLKIGLPDCHLWLGGGAVTENGISFVPNMPTEEVFTVPHREGVEGTVSCSKPLNYAGTLIEEFSVTFEKGRAVSCRAAAGEKVLRSLIETDDGAARLGEVALVPHSSPISQTGLLFYNTLFDENAASHVALGKCYQGCLEGGESMSDEDVAAQGGNDSMVHVDFMIGSSETDVDGLTAGGNFEPVMRSGEWAD